MKENEPKPPQLLICGLLLAVGLIITHNTNIPSDTLFLVTFPYLAIGFLTGATLKAETQKNIKAYFRRK